MKGMQALPDYFMLRNIKSCIFGLTLVDFKKCDKRISVKLLGSCGDWKQNGLIPLKVTAHREGKSRSPSSSVKGLCDQFGPSHLSTDSCGANTGVGQTTAQPTGQTQSAPCFVHKVLLEHSHASSHTFCYHYFQASVEELSGCNSYHMAHKPTRCTQPALTETLWTPRLY